MKLSLIRILGAVTLAMTLPSSGVTAEPKPNQKPAVQKPDFDPASFPALKGTIRDQATLERRPFVRFFACQEDRSQDPPDAPLPEEVAAGKEPFLVVGALAGG